MFGTTELQIESLSAHRVLDKLNGGGIEVLSARKTQKNGITVQVKSKDAKKAFAILRGSCYNVKKVRRRGFSRLLDGCKKSAGSLAGILLFCALVLFMESRVLKIEIAGSGAYYETEVREILLKNGIKDFSPRPRDTAAVTAEILSLPRVSYCSVGEKGGVITVRVEVSDEAAPLKSLPLVAPETGTVEELVVVRGTAVAAVGDKVKKGETLVSNRVAFGGNEREVIVVARVKIRFAFSKEYPVADEAAAIAGAQFDYGEVKEIHTGKTENGWRVSGTAYRESSLNLG